MIPQHSSETNEAYTPSIIVDPSRATMGGIDLDPASCAIAQQVVQAERYLTEADDGCRKNWEGRIFLNPPGGKLDSVTLQPLPRNENGIQGGPGVAAAAAWWLRLVQGYLQPSYGVTEAIFICFTMAVFRTVQSEALLKLFGPMPAPFEFPFCVPASRVNYDKVVWHVVEGNHPSKGTWQRVPTKGAPSDTCIVYLPDKKDPAAGFARFKKNFQHLGRVRE